MCSIVGAAGPIPNLSNKLQAEFHEFLSCLFAMAEVRGRDASGYWVWRKDHYVFEKRPIPAEDLIKRSPRWKSLRFHPGTLYLLHTRAATEGDPNDNINNHPHLGKHSVMVHNGCIFNYSSIVTNEGLTLNSDCDSEVLLKLAEVKSEIDEGLKHMFQVTYKNTGTASIAVAMVDRRQPDRIYCTRNNSNPLFLYRSEKFNCTFFVSTEEIFELALELLYNKKDPRIIGAKSESATPYHLYELTEDGAYSGYHLVTPYDSQTTSQTEQVSKHYGAGIICQTGYWYDVCGEMTPIKDDDDYDDLNENVDDIEFLGFEEEDQSLEMTLEDENELRDYLQRKVKELA